MKSYCSGSRSQSRRLIGASSRSSVEHVEPERAREVRRAQRLGDRAVEQDPAQQQHRLVGERGQRVQVVGGDEDGAAVAGELAQQPRRSWPRERLSTPANGSSSSRMPAPWAMPRATNARLRCPPESCPICRSARSVSSTRSSASSTAAWSAGRARRVEALAAVAAHHDDVAHGDREGPVDVLALRHVADQARVGGPRPGRRRRSARSRASGRTMPMIVLNSVDLPEPFMPIEPGDPARLDGARRRRGRAPRRSGRSTSLHLDRSVAVMIALAGQPGDDRRRRRGGSGRGRSAPGRRPRRASRRRACRRTPRRSPRPPAASACRRRSTRRTRRGRRCPRTNSMAAAICCGVACCSAFTGQMYCLGQPGVAGEVGERALAGDERALRSRAARRAR